MTHERIMKFPAPIDLSGGTISSSLHTNEIANSKGDHFKDDFLPDYDFDEIESQIPDSEYSQQKSSVQMPRPLINS